MTLCSQPLLAEQSNPNSTKSWDSNQINDHQAARVLLSWLATEAGDSTVGARSGPHFAVGRVPSASVCMYLVPL